MPLYLERLTHVRRRGHFGSNESYPESNCEHVMGSNSPEKDYGIGVFY